MTKKYLITWMLVLVVILSACAGNVTPPPVQPTDSTSPIITPTPTDPVPTPTPTDPNPVDYTDVVVNPAEIIIYPAPQGINYDKGNTYNISVGKIFVDEHIEENAWNSIEKALESYVTLDILQSRNNANITIVKNEELNEQGYSLIIDKSGILVEYKDGAGAY